jgi:hypothetical protein
MPNSFESSAPAMDKRWAGFPRAESNEKSSAAGDRRHVRTAATRSRARSLDVDRARQASQSASPSDRL